jgi:hypothetical protein
VFSSEPDHQAGIASAINNDVARVAGLLAVAVLPALAGITPATYSNPALLSDGFSRAAMIAGILCASGGVLAFLTIRNPLPGTRAADDAAHTDPAPTDLTPTDLTLDDAMPAHPLTDSAVTGGPPTGSSAAARRESSRTDPGLGCAACPVLAPHIRPR